jgi:hypothetical protein
VTRTLGHTSHDADVVRNRTEGNRAATRKDVKEFTVAVERFRSALAAAPASTGPPVLRRYLQEAIEDIREDFAALAEGLDPETYTRCKALCADLLHDPPARAATAPCRLEDPSGRDNRTRSV